MKLNEYVFYTTVEDGEWVIKVSAAIPEDVAAKLADGTLLPVIDFAERGEVEDVV